MGTDFFEPVPETTEPERWEPPAWFQPPQDELAALVPDRRLLARADSSGVALVLSHIDVFSTGCVLRIRVSAHRRDGLTDDEWFDFHDVVMDRRGRRHVPTPRRGLPDELLRFGVQFADGSKATTTSAPMPHQQAEEPSGPVLIEHGGGGSGGDRLVASSHALWLWPSPPPEPFDLVVEWPALGVALRRVTIDGERIAEAAETARVMWDDTDRPSAS